VSGLALIAVFLVVAFALPRPGSVTPEGWRLTGIFAATILGLMLQPIAGGALVLIAVAASALVGGLSIEQALAGYADPTVWLVLAAFFISRALIKTGLARRIALFFVRLVGRSSLGVSYALALSDMVLASIIPSNAARSGGVILPIARAIAELYGSHPGATARLLGSFLMIGVYQGICVTAAMFYTGQASNPLAARIAESQVGYEVTWLGWFLAGLAPGLCSLAAAPYMAYRLNPPEIKQTPQAAEFAARELKAMGRLSRGEKLVGLVFLTVCGLWVTSPWHRTDIAIPALLGAAALLVCGVLDWEDVKSEKSAWDIFIWYGGLLRLGKALNDAGVTSEFARALGSALSSLHWVLIFLAALLIYFYAHYMFASITAHILAMYPPFLGVLIATGAPVGLVVFGFACFTNLAAGLTHYGTTPAPMYYAQDYVSFRQWWKTGLVCSVVNILIWCTVGFAWWKLLRIW
jgi:DASS family divalent anion:Na+ symporter